jgi:hypothetical protein
VKALALVLLLLAACHNTVGYRAVTYGGDACARRCRHDGGDDAYQDCIRRCPGIAREAGGCSDDSSATLFCAEFKEGGGNGRPILVAVIAGVVTVGLVFVLFFSAPSGFGPRGVPQ